MSDIGLGAIAVYLVLINIGTFLVFAWDKYCSEHDMWRIPERTLLTLALIGGSPAMLVGQRVLRHKTVKEPFRTQLLGIVVLQVVGAAALGVPGVRDALAEALRNVH